MASSSGCEMRLLDRLHRSREPRRRPPASSWRAWTAGNAAIVHGFLRGRRIPARNPYGPCWWVSCMPASFESARLRDGRCLAEKCTIGYRLSREPPMLSDLCKPPSSVFEKARRACRGPGVAALLAAPRGDSHPLWPNPRQPRRHLGPGGAGREGGSQLAHRPHPCAQPQPLRREVQPRGAC